MNKRWHVKIKNHDKIEKIEKERIKEQISELEDYAKMQGAKTTSDVLRSKGMLNQRKVCDEHLELENKSNED